MSVRDATLPLSNSPGRSGPQVSREAWLRLAACTGAAALLQLDGTLITVALPTVAHGLKVSSCVDGGDS